MQVPIECSIYLDDSIYDLLLERVSHLIVWNVIGLLNNKFKYLIIF
jgi:hypothetical protein